MHLGLRSILFLVVLAFGMLACEPGVVFTDPQPYGFTPCQELPPQFIGRYRIDADQYVMGKEWPDDMRRELLPWLELRTDSVMFWEYRTEELHANYLDSTGYALRDGYLFRDGKQLGLLPAWKEGDAYHYVSGKRPMLLLAVKPDTIQLDEKAGPALITRVIAGNNYFVINLCVPDVTERWLCFYIQALGPDELRIKSSEIYSGIDKARLQKIVPVTDTGNKFYVSPNDESSFMRVINEVFVDFAYFKRITE